MMYHLITCFTPKNRVLSALGRNDSWPTMGVANLTADSQSGSLDSYSTFLVTIHLSRLVSEIFARAIQMDNADHYYSWPPHSGGPADNDATL